MSQAFATLDTEKARLVDLSEHLQELNGSLKQQGWLKPLYRLYYDAYNKARERLTELEKALDHPAPNPGLPGDVHEASQGLRAAVVTVWRPTDVLRAHVAQGMPAFLETIRPHIQTGSLQASHLDLLTGYLEGLNAIADPQGNPEARSFVPIALGALGGALVTDLVFHKGYRRFWGKKEEPKQLTAGGAA